MGAQLSWSPGDGSLHGGHELFQLRLDAEARVSPAETGEPPAEPLGTTGRGHGGGFSLLSVGDVRVGCITSNCKRTPGPALTSHLPSVPAAEGSRWGPHRLTRTSGCGLWERHGVGTSLLGCGMTWAQRLRDPSVRPRGKRPRDAQPRRHFCCQRRSQQVAGTKRGLGVTAWALAFPRSELPLGTFCLHRPS